MKKISDEYQSTKGVISFYQDKAGNYSNPHEFLAESLLSETISKINFARKRALDLACGSGEATGDGICSMKKLFAKLDQGPIYLHTNYMKIKTC